MTEDELMQMQEDEETAMKNMNKMVVKDADGENTIVPSRKQMEIIVD